MALPSSGVIKFSDVNVELGVAANTTRKLSDSTVRTLFGVASGRIALSNGFGKSNAPRLRLLYTVQGNNTNGDYFGQYTAINDNYFAASSTTPQVVHVFNKAIGALHFTLSNPNSQTTSTADNFGSGLAMNTNFLAVSAPAEFSPSTGASAGVVYIYNLSNGVLAAIIQNPNPAKNGAEVDFFGFSISMTDSHIAVGAIREGNPVTGAVYIFRTSDWTLTRTISNPLGTNSQFGHKVSLNGNYVYIDANLANSNQGQSWIFDITTGAQITTVSAAVEGSRLGLGTLTNSYYIQGLPADNFNTVKIYSKTGSLVRTITNPNLGDADSNNDLFGNMVAATDEFMIVSAPYDGPWSSVPFSSPNVEGVVYVINTATGETLFRIPNPAAPALSYFGYNYNPGIQISISGKFFIVGAPHRGALPGRAYVYELY